MKRKLNRIRGCLWVALCLTSIAPACHADQDQEALNNRLANLYQQVLSPFCPGRSLNDCPSSKAQELKNDMRRQIEEGTSEAQVLDQVFTTFGDQYRAVPRYDGFGRLVWWIPALFLLAGGVIIWFFLSRRRHNTGNGVLPEGGTLSAELKDILKQELEGID